MLGGCEQSRPLHVCTISSTQPDGCGRYAVVKAMFSSCAKLTSVTEFVDWTARTGGELEASTQHGRLQQNLLLEGLDSLVCTGDSEVECVDGWLWFI